MFFCCINDFSATRTHYNDDEQGLLDPNNAQPTLSMSTPIFYLTMKMATVFVASTISPQPGSTTMMTNMACWVQTLPSLYVHPHLLSAIAVNTNNNGSENRKIVTNVVVYSLFFDISFLLMKLFFLLNTGIYYIICHHRHLQHNCCQQHQQWK